MGWRPTRWIERPPLLFRILFPECVFRIGSPEKRVFLTFDDGPIPEVTPWVLDVLDSFGIKATFFMVGDNVRKHPEVFQEVVRRGHAVGNHTMHHLQGSITSTRKYVRDVREADALIGSNLFRPPHGLMRWAQAAVLKRSFVLVMYDLITRDYSRHLTAEDVFQNVVRFARPGAVIVFHDSLKSISRLREALPRSLEWLRDQGYSFELLSDPASVMAGNKRKFRHLQDHGNR